MKRYKREELKKLGYILTDFRYQTLISNDEYDFIYVMTNGKNFIYETGAVLSENEIKKYNKEIIYFMENGIIERDKLFIPYISKSEFVDIEKENLNGEVDVIMQNKQGDLLHITKVNEELCYCDNGKIYHKDALGLIRKYNYR